MTPTLSMLKFVAETKLPTEQGELLVRAYRNERTGHEPLAILSGIDTVQNGTTVRIHDACFTSEVLHSTKCDCNQQFQFALQYIRDHGGIVIYLHQEGRGIGLANKLAAYSLQETGLDTIEANRALHLPDDCRSYGDAAAILQDLGINQIKILTNNPRKISEMNKLGIEVLDRIPIETTIFENSLPYLRTKVERMGHIMDLPSTDNSKDID